MINLTIKNKETHIDLEFTEQIGSKPKITITGTADLKHHLIEGCFDILDRLARMENVGHQSGEWRK